MMNRYLIQAPTVVVIGVAGAATWPSLFPHGEQAPTRRTSKPPPMETYSSSGVGLPSRDPFQIGGTLEAASMQNAKASSSKETVEAKPEKSAPPKPDSSPEEEIIAGMRLGGIYIGASAPVAIIDDQVYSLGEQLRKADGSLLPYVITQIRRDHAVVRKGRRDFMIAFSDDPAMAVPKAPSPVIASTPPPANPDLAAISAGSVSRPKGLMPRDRAGGDTASMLLRLLSGMGGSSGGLGSLGGGGSSGGGGGVDLSMLSGLLGGSGGGALGSASSTPINATTLQTGLDALMGKFDNIGQGGAIPGQSGGNNP